MTMTKKRLTYSVEFKNETACLVLDKNYSVNEASDTMGIGYTAVRRWVAQLKSEREGHTPTGKAMTSDQQEIQALQARIKKIEWENDILKKATALLITDTVRR